MACLRKSFLTHKISTGLRVTLCVNWSKEKKNLKTDSWPHNHITTLLTSDLKNPHWSQTEKDYQKIKRRHIDYTKITILIPKAHNPINHITVCYHDSQSKPLSTIKPNHHSNRKIKIKWWSQILFSRALTKATDLKDLYTKRPHHHRSMFWSVAFFLISDSIMWQTWTKTHIIPTWELIRDLKAYTFFILH